jgi:hypothetical protein
MSLASDHGPIASKNERAGTPQERKGCTGCLKRGCACFGIGAFVLLIWVFWPGSLREASTKMSLWPPTTRDILYSEDMDNFVDEEGMYTPAGYLEPLIKEAGLSRNGTASITRLGTQDGPLVIFETTQAGEVMRRLKAREYAVRDTGGRMILTSPGSRPFGVPVEWLAANENVLIAGSRKAIDKIIGIIDQSQPCLLQARPELRPFFYHMETSRTLWAVLQDRSVEAAASKLPPVLMTIKATVGPLASLLTIQAMGIGAKLEQDGCSARFAQLYGSRFASFTVARLHLFIRLLNGLTSDDDPSKARSMSTFRSGRFVSLDMIYDENHCAAARADQRRKRGFISW